MEAKKHFPINKTEIVIIHTFREYISYCLQHRPINLLKSVIMPFDFMCSVPTKIPTLVVLYRRVSIMQI